MIVSGRVAPQASPALRAFALFCAVALLPLGVAYAQDASSDSAMNGLTDLITSGELTVEAARQIFDAMEPVEWAAQRYAAGATEIDQVIAAGRMTAEEGEAKKQAMATMLQSMSFYIEVLGLSTDAARQKAAAESGRTVRTKQDGVSFEWMVEHLMKADVPREQIKPVMNAIKKLVEVMRQEGGGFELHPEMQAHLASLGLTVEQTKLVVGLAARGLGQMSSGVSKGEARTWMLEHIVAAGIPREQIEPFMDGIKKIVGGMKEQSERYAMSPELRAYFVGMGCSDEQIKLAQGLAVRASLREPAATSKTEGIMLRLGVNKKLIGVFREKLTAGGITAEQYEPVLGGMIRIILEMKAEGEAFHLDPRIVDHLLETGLTMNQIELAISLSRRAIISGDAEDQPSYER